MKELERFITALRAAKEAQPYLRIGQIIVNAAPNRQDPFYVSDEVLTQGIFKNMGQQ